MRVRLDRWEIDHYVLGIDDAYIAEGTYATREEADEAANVAWVTPAYLGTTQLPWKIDIEARDAAGNTLSVETWYEDDTPYFVY